MLDSAPQAGLKQRLHEIIFEADTPEGKAFDVALILTILLSVAVVLLESMASFRADYVDALHIAEWIFTILITTKYGLRLYSVGRPMRYALSFYGIVDLLAVIPTYLSVLFPGAQYLLVIRVLRIFRSHQA